MSRCLDDNELAALVEGKLGAPRSALIEQHLRRCEDCRVLLSAVARAGSLPGALLDDEREDPSRAASAAFVLARGSSVDASGNGPSSTPAPIEMHLAQRIGHELKRTYRLERMIGQGGMGVVYAASHVRLAKRYAIKLLAPSLARSAESLERFRREAEITSRLAHPNIVEVLDFDYTEDGLPFMVMELLRGVDLSRHLLLSGGALSLVEVEAIVSQTARALSAAHGAGVVHRDLKPGVRSHGTHVIYRLDPDQICETGHDDCHTLLTDHPVRLDTTSPAEGNLDVALVVGQQRRAVATFQLNRTMRA